MIYLKNVFRENVLEEMYCPARSQRKSDICELAEKKKPQRYRFTANLNINKRKNYTSEKSSCLFPNRL